MLNEAEASAAVGVFNFKQEIIKTGMHSKGEQVTHCANAGVYFCLVLKFAREITNIVWLQQI